MPRILPEAARGRKRARRFIPLAFRAQITINGRRRRNHRSIDVATSSITANFKITDPKAARAFADGYTRFDDDLSPRLPAVRMRILRTAADVRKLFLRKGAGRAI